MGLRTSLKTVLLLPRQHRVLGAHIYIGAETTSKMLDSIYSAIISLTEVVEKVDSQQGAVRSKKLGIEDCQRRLNVFTVYNEKCFY